VIRQRAAVSERFVSRLAHGKIRPESFRATEQRHMQTIFFQTSLDDASKYREDQIRRHVKALPETDFEAGERSQICELIAAKYQFPEMPEFASGQIEYDPPAFTQGSDRVSITVYFPCKGDLSLFQLYHRSRPGYPPPPAFEIVDGMPRKTFVLDKRHVDTIEREVASVVGIVKEHSSMVRDMLPRFNEHLSAVAREAFNHRVHEIDANKQTAAKLSQSKMVIRRRNDGAETIIVPVQRKPVPLSSPDKVDPVREYVLGITEYNDILTTISSMVKVMERTPEVFVDMNEEPLRTILLVALNGIYEGQATGETFNGHGKTDILIRKGDRNVFIAECLMWRGQAYLQKKIDEQLLRYAMWRDSKLALVVFNRGGEFTHAIETMKSTIKAHPQCVKTLEWSHESGARYLFRRHDDASRHFLLTALAFDVPSKDLKGDG
jgi:hypothetical protein